MSLAIGVDLGGTHVLAVLMDQSSGQVYARDHATLQASDRGSRETIAAKLSGCIHAVCNHVLLFKAVSVFESVNQTAINVSVGQKSMKTM